MRFGISKKIETVVNITREMIFAVFECLVSLITQRPCPTEQKRVLIVRVDAIGDFILWLDAAKALREIYPPKTATITLFGNKAWTSLAEHLPYFDEVWSMDRRRFFKNPLYRFSLLSRIHQAGFDIVVSPAFSREFHYADAVVRASGAVERTGSSGDLSNASAWQKRLSDHWFTRIVAASAEPLMELERNAEFMRGLGLSSFRAGMPVLSIKRKMPSGFSLENYYVLFPGASVGAKQWSPPRFAELAERIYRTTGWIGVVCGGPGEEAIGEVIRENTDAPVFNWSSRTSIQELVTVIAGAHLLVGNDTSGVHIAAAVSVPSVCIAGGGHFGRFMPYRVEVETDRPLPAVVSRRLDCFGCNWECAFEVSDKCAVPCVENISLDDVWEAVERILVSTAS